MKLLMMYANSFAFQPNIKTLENARDTASGGEVTDALIGFIYVEAEDEANAVSVDTKLAKNLKWAARKNNTNRMVLHSFAHLSESNSAPELAGKLFDNLEVRLRNSGYEVMQSPFGYFHHLQINAPGYPFARLFKSF